MTDQELIEKIADSLAEVFTEEEHEWSDFSEDIHCLMKKYRKELYEKYLKKHQKENELYNFQRDLLSLEEEIKHLEVNRQQYESLIMTRRQELETLKTKIK
jgi:RecB family exonuclease